jgi:primosomal protein N' (replication factor Y)
MLDRPDLRAAQEAVSRWFAAISLVRSADSGGAVVLVADPSLAAVQAIVRNDPVGFSDRELLERDAVHLPPHYRVAELTGQPRDVADLLAQVHLPAQAQVLGPVPVPALRTKRGGSDDPVVRALVVVPSSNGVELSRALAAGSAVRSARKEGAPVTVRIDPIVLG